MSSDTKLDNFDAETNDAIRVVLASIDSLAAAGWSSADQVRVLRQYLERGLDEMERAEDAYYALLGECVALAADNMQEARLWALESQVAQLADPPVLLEDLLTDIAILVFGELLVIAGVYYGIPAAAAFITSLGVTWTGRRLAGALAEESRAVARIGRLVREYDELQETLWRVSRRLRDADVAADPQAFAGMMRTFVQTQIRIRSNRDELAFARTAFDGGAAAVDAMRAAQETVRNGGRLTNSVLQSFLDNTLGQTAVARAAEEAGPDIDAMRQMLERVDPAGPPPSFETSSFVGSLLSAVAREREAAHHDWADLRLRVRSLPDAVFLASTAVHELFRRVVAHPPRLAGIHHLAPALRPPMVTGVERYLWLAWLRYNGLLEVRTGVGVNSTGPLAPGGVHNGFYIIEVDEDVVPLQALTAVPYTATGDFYPLIPRLNDELTEYLYRKFARAYFVADPSRLYPPLTFDAARYDEAPALPRVQMGFINQDRVTRFDEMRLLVAIYFLDSTTRLDQLENIRKLLHLEPGQDLQELLEEEAAPPFPEPLPGQLGPLAALADQLKTALTASGVDRMWLAGEARARLEVAVADLDAKITAYPLRFDGGPPPPLGALTADDARVEIGVGQQALAARYQEFLDMAADRPDLVDAVSTDLGARLDALSRWAPEDDAALAWRFPTSTTGGSQS